MRGGAQRADLTGVEGATARTGDAVRAMIPASALSRLVTAFAVHEEHTPNDSDELSSSDLFVYNAVRERGECTGAYLREKFGAGVEARLRRLCARKYLTRRVCLKDASQGLTERLWCLALPNDRVLALISSGEIDGFRISSPKQKEVLRVLLESEEPMTAQALTSAAGVTEAPLKSLLSKGLLQTVERRVERNPYAAATFVGQTPLTLNTEQSAALDTLSSLAFSSDAKAALLHGVTGSGKTAVMTALIDRLLEQNKGVILLLPEIALTPQSVSLFCARFGGRVAVIHSGLSAGERYDAYRRIRTGDADVVLGTRSAVFAPVKNLGAIIIDEEQEHTYKSDMNPKYRAHDVARFRCAAEGALMLLASATPSLESYHKAVEGKYTLIKLTRRYGRAVLPEVILSDMRRESQTGNTSPLGTLLCGEIAKNLEVNKQSILFLNRRGYHRFVSCRSCGQAVTCERCSVAMTYHTHRGSYTEGELVCHFCGDRKPLPHLCPVCSSEHLVRGGYGTQRIEQELGELFPSSRVLRMDTDTTSSKHSYDRMLGEFRAHNADILLGTQMVTKGHDFPDVTLVGVLSADASLYLDDYRAGERTFAQLTQVIGRAGRAETPGRAIIQTSNPDNDIIRLACAQDYETFYSREIKLRRLLVFPPFCDIALLSLSCEDEKALMLAAKRLYEETDKRIKGEYSDVKTVIFGPFEAPVYRVDNKFRMRMVVKCRLNKRTRQMFASLLTTFGAGGTSGATLSVDFNPSTL